MQLRRGRLIQAIEVGGGDLQSLTHRLREVETEINRLSAAITVHRPMKLEPVVNSIRDQVLKCLMHLRETTQTGDVAKAKEALAKHIGRLVLTPVQRNGRRVYQVSGNVNVQPDTEKYRMQWTAVPGRHVFNRLQRSQSRVSFRFVPKTLVR